MADVITRDIAFFVNCQKPVVDSLHIFMTMCNVFRFLPT